MDLKRKPFYLDDTAIEWVNNTLNGLTEDEKIGQLFFPIGFSTESFEKSRYWRLIFQTWSG